MPHSLNLDHPHLIILRYLPCWMISQYSYGLADRYLNLVHLILLLLPPPGYLIKKILLHLNPHHHPRRNKGLIVHLLQVIYIFMIAG
jgi:hypothetical protein